MLAEAIFAYLAAAIVILSVLVITRRNPVHSVITMLLLFFHIAALYLTLNAEFLAAIQVIVYAGAILVLFLFVILLLDLREEMVVSRYVGPWPLGLLAALGLLFMIVLSLKSYVAGPKGPITAAVIKAGTHTKVLGKVLFIEYLYPFEIVSVILLVAIIGAIVLAKKRLRS
ncbi:MAG TPA: NADH-quinone oxidoreductase subunit J [Thermodesulfovibrionales bacterium]|nr:NADH-quinone oxidoreductase subunit J [Thermodesulfovibrionales bacterium]